jgi:hypothetical protein
VAAENLLEGATEHLHIEGATKPNGRGHIVEGAVGLELVEEPEALLGERKRQ